MPEVSLWRTARGQLLVTSGVTLVFESCMGHQLEYIKIMKQITMKPYPQIVYDIYAPRGLIGFWDAFLPWGATQAVTKGAVFGFAHNILKRLMKMTPLSPGIQDTLAGAGAGGVQGLVLSPFLLLKTRIMTSVSAGPLTVFLRVVREEGVLSLMKGSGMFAAKRVGDWGSRFAFTNVTESYLRKYSGKTNLNYTEKGFCALTGGLLSSLATIPIDVMVANIQSANAAGKSVTLLDSFKDNYAKGGMEGVVGFATRGLLPRCLHVALTTVVVKSGTTIVQDYLDPPRPTSSSR